MMRAVIGDYKLGDDKLGNKVDFLEVFYMSQFSIPCSVYRGGTSRGLFFQEKDLPADKALRNRIFTEGIDSYEPSQVDGLGGTTSSTNKICVLGPASVPGADVDWTFFQLGISSPVVDEKGTCGNLMAAVGAFAIDEGLVKVDSAASMADVYVYNTNIKKLLHMEIPVIDGKAKVVGDYHVPGVRAPGAKITISIVQPGGELTGELLSFGPVSTIATPAGTYEVTFSDLINPFVFVPAKDMGFTGTEARSEVAADLDVLEELNLIRDKAAVLSKIAENEQDARANKPNVPKIAMIAPAQDYVTVDGELIKKDEVDLLTKVVSSGKLHRTSPASGLYNLAVASLVEGTIPNKLAGFPKGTRERTVRIGHPEGVVEVQVRLEEDMQHIASVGMERTARRIMKGDLYIPYSQRIK